MGRADGDGDADFADAEVSQPVDDRASAERPALAGFGLKLVELLFGHLAVGFVFQRARLSLPGDFAHRSQEQDRRTGQR